MRDAGDYGALVAAAAACMSARLEVVTTCSDSITVRFSCVGATPTGRFVVAVRPRDAWAQFEASRDAIVAEVRMRIERGNG